MNHSKQQIVHPEIGSGCASWYAHDGTEIKMVQFSLGSFLSDEPGVYVLCSLDDRGLVPEYVGQASSLRGRLNDDLTWHPLWKMIVAADVHYVCARRVRSRDGREALARYLVSHLQPRLQRETQALAKRA